MKTFTNSENCSESHVKNLQILKKISKATSNFCPGFFPCYWLILSRVYPLLDARKSLFRAMGGYQKAGTRSLKWVVSKDFQN